MKIGLVAVDKTRYPNLALMKISAYHKTQGDEVEWADPMFGEYDRVYASKIFTFSPNDTNIYNANEIIKGGTGVDLHSELPPEIDRLQPDYSIYPQIDDKTAYGFITRGCPNKCKWCVVPQKEGVIRPYMTVDEISMGGGRPNMILFDNNILASDFGIEQLVEIADKGYRIDLNQGNSARLVTPEIAELFARIKWLAPIRFAADTPKQIAEVENAMRLIDAECEKLGKTPRQYLIYTMIGDDINESYERLTYFRQFKNVRIVAQPYRDFNNPHQVIPKWQMDMARWAIKHNIYFACDFKEFEPRKNFVCKEYF